MIAGMGLGTWLLERLKRLDRPADPSLLKPGRGGSERMLEADSAEEASGAAREVRRGRDRSRRRWDPYS